jgi:hypothetical protein
MTTYRVEFWYDGDWKQASHDYENLEDAEARMKILLAGDTKGATYRIVKCTLVVVEIRETNNV